MDNGQRMRKFVMLFFSLMGLMAEAQYNGGEYYTDSDVRKRVVGLGVHANPYYNNRRLLSNSLNPGQVFNLVNDATEGSWRVGWGVDLYISISDNFELVTGVAYSSYEFAYPSVQRDDFLDTLLSFRLEETSHFLTVPIGVSFRTELDDGWWLEFIPSFELSWLLDYEGYFERQGFQRTEDFMPLAQDFYSWVAIQAGGTYRPFDTWGYSLRFEGRYMLNSLIQRSDYPRETLYSIGAHLGIQYRF